MKRMVNDQAARQHLEFLGYLINPLKRIRRFLMPVIFPLLSACLLLGFMIHDGLILNTGSHYPHWFSSERPLVFRDHHLAIKALCDAYNQSQHSCCTDTASLNHTVQSWFGCIQQNDISITNHSAEGEPDNHYRKWAKFRPPEYKILEHYYWPDSVDQLQRRTCPYAEEFRNLSYHMLRYWIEFARVHNIVWWITYGTLLGAVR